MDTRVDDSPLTRYAPSSNLLDNRIVVVSGAGAGIGRVAAKAFAAHGATVILLGRTLAKLEAVYDEIENAGHPKPAIFPINFEGAAPEDYQQLNTALTNEFGRLDGLLHNASLLGPRTPIAQYPLNDWQKVLQVNVTACFLLTSALLPLLQKSADARVLFTSDNVGQKGRAYWGAYAVSNAASDNLMEVLADELENTAIRVNSIDPGAVRTELRASAYPAENPASIKTPEEIMNRYLFLMGPDSREVHGLRVLAQPQ